LLVEHFWQIKAHEHGALCWFDYVSSATIAVTGGKPLL
jgi:hypothetical protein